jgi:hypothetical protein
MAKALILVLKVSFCLIGRAGHISSASVLSFACPKESNKEKGSPQSFWAQKVTKPKLMNRKKPFNTFTS